jgi:hypothetical protein
MKEREKRERERREKTQLPTAEMKEAASLQTSQTLKSDIKAEGNTGSIMHTINRLYEMD